MENVQNWTKQKLRIFQRRISTFFYVGYPWSGFC